MTPENPPVEQPDVVVIQDKHTEITPPPPPAADTQIDQEILMELGALEELLKRNSEDQAKTNARIDELQQELAARHQAYDELHQKHQAALEEHSTFRQQMEELLKDETPPGPADGESGGAKPPENAGGPEHGANNPHIDEKPDNPPVRTPFWYRRVGRGNAT